MCTPSFLLQRSEVWFLQWHTNTFDTDIEMGCFIPFLACAHTQTQTQTHAATLPPPPTHTHSHTHTHTHTHTRTHVQAWPSARFSWADQRQMTISFHSPTIIRLSARDKTSIRKRNHSRLMFNHCSLLRFAFIEGYPTI